MWTSNSSTGRKVENPKQHSDSSTAQGSSEVPEKWPNRVYASSSIAPEADKEQRTFTKLGSLKISSKTAEGDRKNNTVGVVKIGSTPVQVGSSEV